jgi:hypothetical protein
MRIISKYNLIGFKMLKQSLESVGQWKIPQSRMLEYCCWHWPISIFLWMYKHPLFSTLMMSRIGTVQLSDLLRIIMLRGFQVTVFKYSYSYRSKFQYWFIPYSTSNFKIFNLITITLLSKCSSQTEIFCSAEAVFSLSTWISY